MLFRIETYAGNGRSLYPERPLFRSTEINQQNNETIHIEEDIGKYVFPTLYEARGFS